MYKGFLSLILHMHLPFVRHPDSNKYLEEKWLYEAITECYLPLIDVFETLINENIDFKLTISLSPTLISMLDDCVLQNKYIEYLEKMIELTEKEIKRTFKKPEFNILAKSYNERYKYAYKKYAKVYKRDLISVFKKLASFGVIEIIACAATHAYLPLYESYPNVLDAQINIGTYVYKKYFNRKPEGIWLPECGFVPSIERSIKEHEINYIITEAHALLYANPRPVLGYYKPIVTPKGLVVFGRDIDSSRQVWSSKVGYPGDFDYRDFYRDIGYDLDYDYIRQYISQDGQRVHTGIKYYRITGNTDDKQLYRPDLALKKADIHALDFLRNCIEKVETLYNKTGIKPIIVCPYDAELFGHWWYEGTIWLKLLLKKLYNEQNTIRLITLSDYILENPVMQISNPCPSSWGYNGYSEYWLNENNDWIYRHLHKACERMTELSEIFIDSDGLTKDALNQAVRELLLAQSSDWAFIMKSGTMVNYAIKRTKEHINNFTRIYFGLKENNLNEEWLRSIEYKNNIFPDIDFRIFSNACSKY